MLHEMLARLAQEFVFERAKQFAGSKFANFIRRDLAVEAKKHLIFLPYELKVKASVGAGNWASVPWLAFFDPLITSSATTGFYVVYLINPQTEEIFLSLNQGTTSVYQEYGETRGREVLRRRAIDLAERAPEYTRLFRTEAIDLGSNESLPLGYEAGHSFGKKYLADRINPDVFYKDLQDMLAAYEVLVDRGGTIPTDTMIEESGISDIEETRKYILSKRIERAANVRNRVLEQRGKKCEGCGLDPEVHFSYSGPIQKIPLDVHHSKPISGLAEGESKRYRIPNDFFVLCPTCHRIIHGQNDPSDLSQLKRKIRFRYALEKPNY